MCRSERAQIRLMSDAGFKPDYISRETTRSVSSIYNLIQGSARVSAAAAEDNVCEDRLYVSPAFKAKYCPVSHKLQ
jgi:hypothetical protein